MAQPSYVAYYGLPTDPFSDLQEPPFIAVAGRQQAVDSVLHLLNYSDDLVFVTGPPGSGKSRLLDQLVRQVEPNIDLALLDVEEAGSEKELLWEVASQLGLEPERPMSTEALQALIAKHCAAQHENHIIPTVAVDDIDALSRDALNGLGALLHGGLEHQSGLRLIGLADDLSEVRRETAALGFSSGQLIELPPLTFDDAVHLVNGYFQSAGIHGGVPLEEGDLLRLYRFSDGRPGAFIDAVRDHMLVAAQRRHRRIRLPWAHLLAGAAVAIVLTVAVLYQTQQGPEQAAVDDAGGTNTTISNDEQAEDQAPAELLGTGDTGSSGSADSEADPGPLSPSEDRRGLSDEEVARAEMESIRARLDAALAERAGEAEGTITGGGENLVGDQPEESGRADSPSDTIAAPTENTDDPDPGDTDGTPEPSFEPIRPALFEPNWLRSAPATGYTLQVVAAREESNVIEFADASGLPMSELGYVLGELQGEPWYMLLYGQFPTSESARQAISGLPEQVRGTAPWPRTISGIKELITSADGDG